MLAEVFAERWESPKSRNRIHWVVFCLLRKSRPRSTLLDRSCNVSSNPPSKSALPPSSLCSPPFCLLVHVRPINDRYAPLLTTVLPTLCLLVHARPINDSYAPFSPLCSPPSAYRSMPTHFRPNSDRYTPFSPLLCSPPSDYWSMSCQSTTVTPPSHYCVPRPPHCLSVLVNFMSGQTATIDGPVDRPRSGHGERSSRD